MADFVNLTPETLEGEHLCCCLYALRPHAGVEKKRAWLRARLAEGHVFRKLDAETSVFIEYAPLERAWTPVEGANFYYVYCLWVSSDNAGLGYGRQLMQYCIDDAKRNGRSGLCLLGAEHQQTWLCDQSFARRCGFHTVDRARGGYELLALSFDGTTPRFTERAREMRVDTDDLVIYYDAQCPHTLGSIEAIRALCGKKGVPASLIEVDTLEKAKALPCVFNNWAVFYRGEFQTVNVLGAAAIERLLR